MLGRKTLLAVGAVVAGLLLPAQTMAQYEAITDADLNLRVGPGTDFGVIDVIPYGDVVDVYGCLDDVEWCDIEWYGLRGWVSAHYLVQPGTSVYLPQVYARIGVPIISFSFSTYHERHYHDRPWFKKRHGRWRGRDWRRGDRPRRHRSEERREAERPQEQHRETERPRKQRQEAEQPRRQREAKPSRQQRQIERAKRQRQQQIQEAEQPRRGQRSQRQGQRSEKQRQRSEKQGQRSQKQGQRSQSRERSGSGGSPPKELEHRGQ